jgi:hypothetical protein
VPPTRLASIAAGPPPDIAAYIAANAAHVLDRNGDRLARVEIVRAILDEPPGD